MKQIMSLALFMPMLIAKLGEHIIAPVIDAHFVDATIEEKGRYYALIKDSCDKITANALYARQKLRDSNSAEICLCYEAPPHNVK